MKILLLNQTFYPDALATSQQVTDLAVYLAEQGHHVSVIAGRRGYENRNLIFRARENYKNVNIYRVNSTGFGKQRFILRLFDALTFDLMLMLRLLFFPAQDIVVCFTSPPLIGILGMMFTSLKGGKLVQWLMDINPDVAFAVGYLKKKSLVGRFLNWNLNLTLKWSDHIIVLDRWMKEVVLNHGATEKEISIIHPWSVIEGSPKMSDSGPSKFRKENGLEGKTVVLYSGNHSVVHPLYTLLEAARLLRQDKSIAFVFVGAGLRTNDVKAFKTEHQLTNIIQLPLQPRESLSDALQTVDAHVVVMGTEVNGLVHTSKIYGSLASGRPIIYIGPEKSHIVDALNECGSPFQARHGDFEKVAACIQSIKAMGVKEKKELEIRQCTYMAISCARQKCLQTFMVEVLKSPLVTPLIDSPNLSQITT